MWFTASKPGFEVAVGKTPDRFFFAKVPRVTPDVLRSLLTPSFNDTLQRSLSDWHANCAELSVRTRISIPVGDATVQLVGARSAHWRR